MRKYPVFTPSTGQQEKKYDPKFPTLTWANYEARQSNELDFIIIKKNSNYTLYTRSNFKEPDLFKNILYQKWDQLYSLARVQLKENFCRRTLCTSRGNETIARSNSTTTPSIELADNSDGQPKQLIVIFQVIC